MSEHLDALRANVANTVAAPPELAAYVEKLKAAGLSEDEIFEQTVSAAISEGLRRLDAASAVIG